MVFSDYETMGKPVPGFRREAAYVMAREFGLESGDAWDVVGKMARALEHDMPERAMKSARAFVDDTGIYCLMVVLLAAVEVAGQRER